MDNHQPDIGAYLLEILTTGMYKEPIIVYREYIQNACDSIHKAQELGILEPEEGVVNIRIDPDTQSMSVEDNGTGIAKDKFRHVMGDIARSEKILGKDKGFRGIGRLAGLAYCEQLVITSSARGENIESVLTCDAQKFRSMLDRRYTASEVIENTFEFSRRITDDIDGHFFRVELSGIHRGHELLNIDEVKNYLAFVAPVDFSPNFIFGDEIRQYAQALGYPIDVYKVIVEDGRNETQTQIFKGYKQKYMINSKGEEPDEMLGIEYKTFEADDGELLGWLWYAQTGFKKSMGKSHPMAGIRLRAGNIQIGDANALQEFFVEKRFSSYVVGELHAVSPKLIPNSQRDYFNENETRKELERQFRVIAQEIGKLSRVGSDANTALKDMQKYDEAKKKYEVQEQQHKFLGEDDRRQAIRELEEKRIASEKGRMKLKDWVLPRYRETKGVYAGRAKIAEARLKEYANRKKAEEEKARVTLTLFATKPLNNTPTQFSTHMEESFVQPVTQKTETVEPSNFTQTKLEQPQWVKPNIEEVKPAPPEVPQPKIERRVDKLFKLSSHDRELLDKAYHAVKKALPYDDDMAEQVISAIEREFL